MVVLRIEFVNYLTQSVIYFTNSFFVNTMQVLKYFVVSIAEKRK